MSFTAEALAFFYRDGIFLVAGCAVATAVLLAILRPLLLRYALARPNARSSHKTPTPQGAGMAVVAVTLTAAALAVMLRGDASPPQVWIVFAAIVLVAIVGAVDDIRALPVQPRLFLQAAGVALVVFALPDGTRVFASLPFWLERALLFVAGLWFMNLSNFMDGLDWMMVAEVLPVAAGLAIAGLLGALPLYAVAISIALFGAMLGFAPFNKPVAKMFLGDVGSLPIGLLIGWLLVLLAGNGHFAAAFLLPLYFVADATLTLARRALQREAIWEAHRTHFYQRATDRGFRVTAIVGQVFALNCGLAALSILTLIVPTRGVAIAAIVIGITLTAVLLANFVRGSVLRG